MEENTSKELLAIIDYLIEDCYTETLEELNYPMNDLLNSRREMKRLAMSGDIESLYGLVNTKHSSLLKKNPSVVSLIFSQIFIEYIRNNQPEKALEFGRNSIQNGQDITTNHDLFLLLAYKNPEACDKLNEFMSIERREGIFTAIDTLIKETEGEYRISMLEYANKLLKYSKCLKKEE